MVRKRALLKERYQAFEEAVAGIAHFRHSEPLRNHTTMRVGGPADLYWRAIRVPDLVAVVQAAERFGLDYLVIGHGSNLVPGDGGYRGLVVMNHCTGIRFEGTRVWVETGHSFKRLFRLTAELGLGNLAFAVGIPGTVGGALVSNAGAYRRNIGDFVRSLDVLTEGQVLHVKPEWMQFSYRDSRLRHGSPQRAIVLTVELELEYCDRQSLFAEAEGYQKLRRERQPGDPSAGSFFKNVYDRSLAERLPNLPENFRLAGVVPAGFLISGAGCKGMCVGDAQISPKHGNFLINLGHATATQVRHLAEQVKQCVFQKYGVMLEEEVLYVGEWEESQARSRNPGDG